MLTHGTSCAVARAAPTHLSKKPGVPTSFGSGRIEGRTEYFAFSDPGERFSCVGLLREGEPFCGLKCWLCDARTSLYEVETL